MTLWHTTGVGSLPFQDSAEAVDHVFQSYSIPFYPQLVQHERYAASSVPQMLTEAIPQSILKLFIDKSSRLESTDQLQTIWKNENYIHIETLPGLKEFVYSLARFAGSFFKLQIVGPTTATKLLELIYGQPLRDNQRLVINSSLLHLINLILAKCGYSRQAIVIFDEPLSSTLDMTVELKVENALQGIHCCSTFSLKSQIEHFQNTYLSFDINQFRADKSLFVSINRLHSIGGVMLGIVDTKLNTIDHEAATRTWHQLAQNVSFERSASNLLPILTGGCGTGLQTITYEKQLSFLLKELTS